MPEEVVTEVGRLNDNLCLSREFIADWLELRGY